MVEDAAQSQGASRFGRMAGGLGHAAGPVSIPARIWGLLGMRELSRPHDEVIAERIRLIANHGSARKYMHDVIGMNSRLDTVQAVVLNAKLQRLEEWNARRRAAAARYGQLLADVPGVRVPRSMVGNADVWHLYVIRVARRDEVLASLQESGIGAGIHYPYPLHLTRAYRSLGYRRGDFPVAEQAASEILSLPLYPHITPEQQSQVVSALRAAIGRA